MFHRREQPPLRCRRPDGLHLGPATILPSNYALNLHHAIGPFEPFFSMIFHLLHGWCQKLAFFTDISLSSRYYSNVRKHDAVLPASFLPPIYATHIPFSELLSAGDASNAFISVRNDFIFSFCSRDSTLCTCLHRLSH